MATRRDHDSDEDATALDLRAQPRPARPSMRPTPAPVPLVASALSPASSSPPARAEVKRPAPPRAKAPAARFVDHDEDDHQDEQDDDEATEFLAARPSPRDAPRAPSSGEAIPRAQGRAVSIEPGSAPHAPSPLPAPIAAPAVSAAVVATAPLESVATMTTRPEPIRPLPYRSITTDASATGTASVPRVTRIHLAGDDGATTHGDEHAASESTGDVSLPPRVTVVPTGSPKVSRRTPTHVDAHDDNTEASEGADEYVAVVKAVPSPPPPSSPAPSSSSSSSTPSASAPRGYRDLPPSAEAVPVLRRSKPLPEEPHDGVLVVDAPPEAVVTVNGVERGRGTVKVSELDREARHAVRIQCPGHVPWKGSVSLQGKAAAKIRPALKPRAR